MFIPLSCPACREPLAETTSGYRCTGCDAHYAVKEGIPVLLRASDDGLATLEREYWNERFARDADHADLHRLYGDADFVHDDWGLLAYLDRVRTMLPPGSTILEVGTGLGSCAIPLALHHAVRAVVTDVAERALVLNRRVAADLSADASVEYYAADALHLPFADAVFDAVMTHAALHHLEQPGDAVREMARCLRPGGLLVLGYEPNRTVLAPLRWVAGRLRLSERYSRRFVPGRYSVADDEARGFSPGELTAWLEQSGLRLEWMTPVWLVGAVLYHVQALVHAVSGRWIAIPARLQRSARALDRKLLLRTPAVRRLSFAWSVGARKDGGLGASSGTSAGHRLSAPT
jgi:SAM-dependent methyltransferase